MERGTEELKIQKKDGTKFDKKDRTSLGILIILLSALIFQGCDSDDDDCTRIDRIGGGLIPERELVVPCDFPEPEPLGFVQEEVR